jgi:hypothetical protein
VPGARPLSSLLTASFLLAPQIFGPAGEGYYSVQREKQGTFTVPAARTGLYKLCFSNRMSTLAEKTVAFSLHVGDKLFQDIAKQGAPPQRRAAAGKEDAAPVVQSI